VRCRADVGSKCPDERGELFALFEEGLDLTPLRSMRLGLEQGLEGGEFRPALGWVEGDFFQGLHFSPFPAGWPKREIVASVAMSRMTIPPCFNSKKIRKSPPVFNA
jgi:hypothetical protein